MNSLISIQNCIILIKTRLLCTYKKQKGSDVAKWSKHMFRCIKFNDSEQDDQKNHFRPLDMWLMPAISMSLEEIKGYKTANKTK